MKTEECMRCSHFKKREYSDGYYCERDGVPIWRVKDCELADKTPAPLDLVRIAEIYGKEVAEEIERYREEL